MKEIEDHLRNLRRTDDLSYSSHRGDEQSSATKAETDDPADIAESKMKKMIDQETLLRLIDECKEEEDRLNFLQIMPDDK